MNVHKYLADIAQAKPLTAGRPFFVIVGLGLGDAVWIVAIHDRSFGLRPSSAHLRATSSMLSARHRNSAASSIELPDSIAALRSSISISVRAPVHAPAGFPL
jgi:hypothetical protein